MKIKTTHKEFKISLKRFLKRFKRKKVKSNENDSNRPRNTQEDKSNSSFKGYKIVRNL